MQAECMYSLNAIGGDLPPDSSIARRATLVGHICQFASRFPVAARRPLSGLVQQIMHADEVGQVKVYLNPYGHCVGYLIWALVTPGLEQELLAGATRPLAEWEYNDGDRAWVLDMAVSRGSLPYVLEDLRDSVFRDCDHVTYFRIKQGRRIFKRVSRLTHSNFFMRASRQSRDAA